MPLAPLTPEQSELAGRYYPLAVKMAGEWARGDDLARDEFLDAFTAALCRAAAEYDPDRGVKFGTLLHRTFRCRGVDVLRSRSAAKRGRPGRLDAAGYDPPSPDTTLAVDDADAFDGMLARVGGPERRLLTAIYRDGRTWDEAGYSRLLIRGLLEQATNRLRRRIA